METTPKLTKVTNGGVSRYQHDNAEIACSNSNIYTFTPTSSMLRIRNALSSLPDGETYLPLYQNSAGLNVWDTGKTQAWGNIVEYLFEQNNDVRDIVSALPHPHVIRLTYLIGLPLGDVRVTSDDLLLYLESRNVTRDHMAFSIVNGLVAATVKLSPVDWDARDLEFLPGHRTLADETLAAIDSIEHVDIKTVALRWLKVGYSIPDVKEKALYLHCVKAMTECGMATSGLYLAYLTNPNLVSFTLTSTGVYEGTPEYLRGEYDATNINITCDVNNKIHIKMHIEEK